MLYFIVIFAFNGEHACDYSSLTKTCSVRTDIKVKSCMNPLIFKASWRKSPPCTVLMSAVRLFHGPAISHFFHQNLNHLLHILKIFNDNIHFFIVSDRQRDFINRFVFAICLFKIDDI